MGKSLNFETLRHILRRFNQIGGPHDIYLASYTGGKCLALSMGAYEALGHPEAVRISFDEQCRVAKVEAAEITEKDVTIITEKMVSSRFIKLSQGVALKKFLEESKFPPKAWGKEHDGILYFEY